jgi:hypothetical protein
MKLPFTTEQFLKVFADYNQAIWPIQIFFYLLAFLSVLALLSKSRFSDKFIFTLLAFFWIWMGIVYHILYFSAINKIAYAFGVIFVIQGLVYLYIGFSKNFPLQYRRDIYGITGAAFILFSLVVYPVLGFVNGHLYPASPTFGLPCPTTIFTFGLLLGSVNKLPLITFAIPFLWSLIGFSAALSLGIIEDAGLFVAGLVFIVLNLRHHKSSQLEKMRLSS